MEKSQELKVTVNFSFITEIAAGNLTYFEKRNAQFWPQLRIIFSTIEEALKPNAAQQNHSLQLVVSMSNNNFFIESGILGMFVIV